MDLLVWAPFIWQQLQLHWVSVSLFFTFVTGAGAVALKNKAYAQFAALALEMLSEVVEEELSTEEKRHKLAELVYDNSPLWVRKLVTKADTEKILDKVFETIKD